MSGAGRIFGKIIRKLPIYVKNTPENKAASKRARDLFVLGVDYYKKDTKDWYHYAELTFKEVLKILPGNKKALFNLSRAYIHQGKLDEAKLILETFLKSDRHNSLTLFYLSSIEFEQGKALQAQARHDQAQIRFNQAKDNCIKAIRYDRDSEPDIHFLYSHILEKTGEPEKAEHELEFAVMMKKRIGWLGESIYTHL